MIGSGLIPSCPLVLLHQSALLRSHLSQGIRIVLLGLGERLLGLAGLLARLSGTLGYICESRLGEREFFLWSPLALLSLGICCYSIAISLTHGFALSDVIAGWLVALHAER